MKYFLLAALPGLLLSACSSVSVKDYTHTGTAARPSRIYVAPFDTTTTSVNIGRDKSKTKTPIFKQAAATLLADYTVKNVSKHVAPASKVASAAEAPRSGWLVTGRFTRINSGNRGMRMIVGLGAGGSKMETSVEVFDLAKGRDKPFMRFSTSGGSNAMPGLITSGGPGVGAAYSMIYAAGSGMTDDAARTSRMITGALSEYFGERGWTPRSQVFKVKKPGEYQLVHGM
jgi:hypothetical protein